VAVDTAQLNTMQDVAQILQVVVSLALALFASWVLLKPMLVNQFPEDLSREEFKELVLRKEIALTSLEELEQDYRSGKMEEQEYNRLRSELNVSVAQVLQRLKEIGS